MGLWYRDLSSRNIHLRNSPMDLHINHAIPRAHEDIFLSPVHQNLQHYCPGPGRSETIPSRVIFVSLTHSRAFHIFFFRTAHEMFECTVIGTPLSSILFFENVAPAKQIMLSKPGLVWSLKRYRWSSLSTDKGLLVCDPGSCWKVYLVSHAGEQIFASVYINGPSPNTKEAFVGRWHLNRDHSD